MKIVSHELYKGLWPEAAEDETYFYSNEEMLAHPQVMAEAEVINIHPYMLKKDYQRNRKHECFYCRGCVLQDDDVFQKNAGIRGS